MTRWIRMFDFRWRNNVCLKAYFAVALLILALPAIAQDIKLNVTYVCNGEKMYVENCNIRDLSDTSKCMVGHPDRPSRNGMMVYTYETRGDLKKLLPTCKQPSAKELAAAEAFEKKQKQLYDAAVQKANPQPAPAPAGNAPVSGSGLALPPSQTGKTPEQRAMNRCVSSGRLPATCTGNSLLGAFGKMISQVLPSAAQEPATGPAMAGVFQGAGNWRLDFTDESVLVNCSFLSPDEHRYKVEIKNNLALVTIDTTPKPLVLTVKPDGTLTAPGPREIDGVVAAGTTGGPSSTHYSGYKDQYGKSLSDSEAASTAFPVYDSTGNRVYGAVNAGAAPHTTFAPKRTTCPALNLASKGSVGVIQMQTDLLKTVFGGDKGPPTPPGIRMHGIFAASTGFSLQFFPESVILGCGPDAARAYPYTMVADGTKAVLKIDAPDHPLNVAFRPDGSLDAGTGPYQVHGRIVTGQDNNGDFKFAPYEQTCNLAVLSPSKEIPSAGGGPATMVASGGTTAAASNTGAGTLSTPDAPLGNATLSIVSGFPAQAGVPNPLAGRPYVLLRDSYPNALAKGGVTIPAGTQAFKYVSTVCANRTPECQQSMNAIKTNAASAVRADANGAGTFPGVPPGTYYLMISTRYNNQPLFWGQAVQLKAGSNSLKLDASNAVPIN